MSKTIPLSVNRQRHPAMLRVSSLVVAGILSVLMVTAVLPPIVADQSDRAVVNAPVTLLTAPIDGQIESMLTVSGHPIEAGDALARISNVRLDRGTLISLSEKVVDAREKLEATQAKKNSDRTYVASLDAEMAAQTAQLKTQFLSQIVELRARVAESESLSGEKKALVDRQSNMVARAAASEDMLRPTTQQYAATLHKADAERAKLNQKIQQLGALEKGVYVGDDLIALGALAQKRRDIDFDAKRMEIEEKELSTVLQEKQRLIDTEQKRLGSLTEAEVRAPTKGKLLNVVAAPGRHVNAGDSVASLVDCERRFVVAIFSYRQGQSLEVGTKVRVGGGAAFGPGIVTAVLPKTSDKTDEGFAVPFPQTERRELYAIISPESPAENASAQEATVHSAYSTPCKVGQWVTVTKDNGFVPSMSVSWARLGTLLTAWSNKTPPQLDSAYQTTRETGIAVLGSALRSTEQGRFRSPGPVNWLQRSDDVVSR